MIKINDRRIGDGEPVFIIAEAGVNHNGDIEIAKQLVDIAVEARADAVKFQTFKADNLVTKNAPKAEYQKKLTSGNETQYQMLKKLELSYEDYIQIKEYCDKRNIIFMSTPFDVESVGLLEDLKVQAYKISSGDITNIPLLKHIAKLNKPIILSTGMSNLGEVEKAVEAIKDESDCDIILLHCTSNYPTKYKDVNLMAMQTMKNAFKTIIGYSDHTLGIEVPIAAVALGASVIEKHFTIDKEMNGPDHKASLNPEQLGLMIKSIRNIEKSFGDGVKKITKNEISIKKVTRKSIVARYDLEKGTIISLENIDFKRPGTGIDYNKIDGVIGRKVNRDIKKDEILKWKYLD